jgi:hypothetical protein
MCVFAFFFVAFFFIYYSKMEHQGDTPEFIIKERLNEVSSLLPSQKK